MKCSQMARLIAAGAVLGLTACESMTDSGPNLYDDATITADVASSAGDAIAIAIESMVGNEIAGSLSNVSAGADVAPLIAHAVNISRTRTCYDAASAVVSGCTPLSSVRKIVTQGTIEGDRSGTRETEDDRTVTWSGVVHRAFNDTLTRNFNTAQPPVETSRSHSDVAAGNDTSVISDGTLTRTMSESVSDTVKAVTWNLPRSSNPFPVSGSIVRAAAVKVVVTNGTRTQTRELARKIQVAFPADAQGNVVLTINDKTCNLNLVTHAVSNCQ